MCCIKYPDFTTLKALVTGASSGMGLEYARQLAEKGCSLVIVSNEEQIHTVAEDLRQKYNVTVASVCKDLAHAEAAKELYDWCHAEGHEIDILVNNAGMFMFRDVNATDPARIEAMLNLHIITLTQMCRYFSVDMCQRKRGWIVNMSSLSAYIPNFGIALYSSTKAYIRVFTRSIYWELYDHNVYATAICPGGVATRLLGLPDNLLKLGVNLGVLLTPEKLVKKALRAVFGHRKQIMPGIINHIGLAVVTLLPPPLRMWIRRKFFDK
ncbi:MAG: SDR family NAD(P)-dependent oxidoreductase [Bacteroidaceae bacterium]|nr:SDR family NAD(P)-dependent oxidoreductase [Bacteroidaceae bacterium]